MSVSFANRAPIDRRQLHALRLALREAFATDFDLWCYDDCWNWIPEDSGKEQEIASSEMAACLDPSRRAGAIPTMVDSVDGNSLLLIPLPKQQRRPFVATACFSNDSTRQLLLQLATLFLRGWKERLELEQMRNEHQAFLRQVTNDFEELTFLRGMSALLEISDLSFDFVAMGERMLSTLNPLLDTDALVLVIAEDAKVRPGAERIEPRCWSGLRDVSDETCRNLVRCYHEAAARQPVVKNHFDQLPEGAPFPGVNSFILVPIVTAGATIGWLLALNRDNDRNLNAAALPWGISYLEFGTHEATLMSSSAAILATHARNVELFREREELLVSVVRVLVTAIEAKDEYTCGHSERVALYGKRLAEEIGKDAEYCQRLYLTGLLHDIGKIGVRDAVLRKPAPLNDEEFEEIKQHPDKGWQILHDLVPLQYVLPGVLHHHEQFDGRGYPDRLAGHAIPLHGRILAVCDAFDAMTSDRPYRTGMPLEQAEGILRSGSGKQWDPDLIDAFFRCLPDILQIKQSYRPRAAEARRPTTAANPPTGISP
jgi:hypothetical protein